MAGKSAIKINSLERGKGACDTLKSSIQKIDVARQSAATVFSDLSAIDPDLGKVFIHELSESLNDIYLYLNKKLPKAEAYFLGEKVVAAGGAGGVGAGGGGTPGGGGGGHSTPSTPVNPVNPGGGDDKPDYGDDDVVVASLEDISTGSLDDMKLGDLDSVIDELIKLAKLKNQPLDKYLMDDSNSDAIKQLLLKSPNVPEEFKNIIKDMDSSVVRILFDYILQGNCPEIFHLNTLNLGVMEEYLENVAKENGITIQDLMYDGQYADLLRSTLGGMDSVIDMIKEWENLSPEEFQKQLQSFYYGDVPSEYKDQNIQVTRAYVDYLADACDVYYEDFLTDNSYAETLKEGALQLGKSLTFFKATSMFSNEGMMENVRKLYDGSNYKAYGMTKDNVNSFKKEIDSLAKEKNTTSKAILEDTEYADLVKEMLLKSESAKGVGQIFKKAESSVTQVVAKNLYNTKFEKSKQQEEFDKILAKAKSADANKKSGEEKK